MIFHVLITSVCQQCLVFIHFQNLSQASQKAFEALISFFPSSIEEPFAGKKTNPT